MWLFLAFLAVPLIEIALFIQIGGWIGLWPTLLIVVLTALLGTYMVRSQGRMAMEDMRRSFGTLSDPTRPLAHGAMILVSGALLLTPGFFTDGVGFALLVPAVRDAVMRYAAKRIKVQRFEMGGRPQPTRPPHGPGVIDGEWEEVEEPEIRPAPPGAPPSGWRRD